MPALERQQQLESGTRLIGPFTGNLRADRRRSGCRQISSNSDHRIGQARTDANDYEVTVLAGRLMTKYCGAPAIATSQASGRASATAKPNFPAVEEAFD